MYELLQQAGINTNELMLVEMMLVKVKACYFRPKFWGNKVVIREVKSGARLQTLKVPLQFVNK